MAGVFKQMSGLVRMLALWVACVLVVPSTAGAAELRVVVTVPPLAGIIEPVLPEGATVDILVPPGVSPHGYQFRPSDLQRLARADLVVVNGLGVEEGLERALERGRSEERAEIVFADVVGVEPGENAGGSGHGHNHSHGHGHCSACSSTVDIHLWFDPELAKQLQTAVAERVGTEPQVLASAHAAIDATMDQAAELLVRFRGTGIVVTHDAYRRFFEQFGLIQSAVIRPIETAEPTPGELREAIDAVRAGGAKAVFIEPQMPEGAARRVARAGDAELGTLDPLGTGDWHALMLKNAQSISAALTAAAEAAQ